MAKKGIIALDYYDGPKEGFATAVLDCDACYFRLVAWNDESSFRLFQVVPLSVDEVESLARELGKAQARPATPVWLPRWRFSSSRVRAFMDDTVRALRSGERPPEFLVLAPRSLEPHAKAPVTDVISNRLAVADLPTDLDSWRDIFPLPPEPPDVDSD